MVISIKLKDEYRAQLTQRGKTASLVHQNHFSVAWSHLFPFAYSYPLQASYTLILAKQGKLWFPLTLINDSLQI